MERASQYRKTTSPSHPTLLQTNWREGATPTALKRSHTSSSPIRDGFSRYSNGTPPGCNVNNEVPIESSKPKMPKHFDQPLTCFYWHTYGHCKKADDECLYAHHDTGLVASPPFAMDAGQAPMAGKNAMKQLNEHAKREKELNDREAWLTAREMELNIKSGGNQRLQAVEDMICGIYEVMKDAKAVLSEAQTALHHHHQCFDEHNAERGMQAALDDIGNIVERVSKLEKQAERQLGRPTSMPESVRAYLDAQGGVRYGS